MGTPRERIEHQQAGLAAGEPAAAPGEERDGRDGSGVNGRSTLDGRGPIAGLSRHELGLLVGLVVCVALIPVQITTAYSGLPAHPLLLHVPVVLIPILVLGVLFRVFAPRNAARLRLPLAWLAVISLLSTVLTAASGQALRRALHLGPGSGGQVGSLVAQHAHAAGNLRLLMFVLAAFTILDLFASQPAATTAPSARRRRFQEAISGRRAVLVTEIVVVCLSVATGYFVFRTGDLGARAVWAGRLTSARVSVNSQAIVAANPVGARLFSTSGCASCHTLAAVGARGNVGANLDSLRPDASTVALVVRNGGGGMPSFGHTLSGTEIQSVSQFVAAAAGSAGYSVPTFNPNGTTLAACARTNTFGCYEQAFGNLTYHDGPKQALSIYQSDINRIQTVSTDCHRIGHAMGAAALLRDHGDVGEAMAQGSALCGSGYYHGIMERALYGTKLQGLGPVARRLCANSSVTANPFLDYQCLHGLGHGLMIYTGDDLPLSLRTCDQLATRWAQISCTGGVFMENFTTFYKTRTHWVSSKDLLYPCDKVTLRYKYFCYDLVTARILPQVGWNWKKAAADCWHAERAWIAVCFRSLGRDAWSTNGPSASAALRLCRLAGSMERECDFSAALQIANDTAQLAPAAAFCRRTSSSIRAYCFQGMGVTVSVLDPAFAATLNACRINAGRYWTACVDGSQVGAISPKAVNAPDTGQIFTRG